MTIQSSEPPTPQRRIELGGFHSLADIRTTWTGLWIQAKRAQDHDVMDLILLAVAPERLPSRGLVARLSRLAPRVDARCGMEQSLGDDIRRAGQACISKFLEEDLSASQIEVAPV